MFAFFLPIVAIALVLFDRAERKALPPPSSPTPALIVGAAPPVRQPAANAPPSPLAVLHDYAQRNLAPPPFVIQCAIAEAELIGRLDVAYMIQKTYLVPSLMQGAGAVPMPAPPAAMAPPIDAAATETAAEAAPPPQGRPDLPPPERVTESMAPTATGMPLVSTRSPIPNVPDAAWREFAGRLVREAPTFDTPRHCGRFHHNKDRLLALGFEPAIVLESPDVQDDAFTTDVMDCFRHLQASGTLGQVLGRGVQLPGVAEPIAITLSGVLGLAAVGGLEGAIGWLERASDRSRYPNTTQAFARTNGVF